MRGSQARVLYAAPSRSKELAGANGDRLFWSGRAGGGHAIRPSVGPMGGSPAHAPSAGAAFRSNIKGKQEIFLSGFNAVAVSRYHLPYQGRQLQRRECERRDRHSHVESVATIIAINSFYEKSFDLLQ